MSIQKDRFEVFNEYIISQIKIAQDSVYDGFDGTCLPLSDFEEILDNIQTAFQEMFLPKTISVADDLLQLYTDGASSIINGKTDGGFACAIISADRCKGVIHGYKSPATNQQMELMGVLAGLRYVRDLPNEVSRVEIYSDSAYVVNCFKQNWYVKWRKNGWKSADKKPVKNQEYWVEILDILDELATVTEFVWTHVKGHSGNRWNEYADEYAVKAKVTGRTRGEFQDIDIF